jgi:hypothetical protein
MWIMMPGGDTGLDRKALFFRRWLRNERLRALI